LGSINVASVAPQYTSKRYKALKDVPRKKLVQGLIGKYYSDVDLVKLEETKVDEYIYFFWYGGSPLPSMGPDNFSVEWDGYIRADADDVYWFFTTSDDGIRLWIDDDLIIDNWNPDVSDEQCESLFLERGLHKLKLQYFDSEGAALVTLGWASRRVFKWTVLPRYLFCIPEE
jgi:hypothetical protein